MHTLAFGGNNTLGPIEVSPALTTNRGCHNPGDFEAGALLVAFPEFMSATQVAATEDLCPALGAKNTTAIAYVETVGFSAADNGKGAAYDVCPTMRARGSSNSNQSAAWTLAVAYRDFYDALRVRRLTPEECEVLMGYRRGYTNIPWKRKGGCPDGLRYRALGNSMPTVIMKWLRHRIDAAWRNAHDL